VNNIFELRSDAFKIAVHHRRPIPQRTDTIGPWLDALAFLTWLGALTNSALVYLFRPVEAEAEGRRVEADTDGREKELLLSALLIALAASHGYTIMRAGVRHVVERAVWRRSVEIREKEKDEMEVKEKILRRLGGEEDIDPDAGGVGSEEDKSEGKSLDEGEGTETGFWGYDEGLEDIQKVGKDE